MRKVIIIPVFIVAGLVVFVLTMRHPLPATEQFLSSGPLGLVSAQAYMLPLTNPTYAPIRNTTVADPVLDANEALLYDVDTGSFLYQKNPDAQVPIASLTKLLSTLVVLDHFDSGEVVTVASGSVRVDGQSQTLYDGERLTVGNLTSMMLVESSNDAAYALADYAKSRGIDFIAEMNKKAVALGMTNCKFTNPAGLDDEAYCTARDMLRLVRAGLRQAPQIWPLMATQQLTITSVDGKFSHTIKSTNDLLGQIPGIVGGKTGNTDGALGCLMLVVKLPGKGDTLVSIVLGSRSRFGDTRALFDWVGKAYHWQ